MTRAGSCVEVAIEQLGGRGDGIAMLGDQRVFVPLALPGDRLTVLLGARREGGFAAEPVTWQHQVPRAAPHCPHFGTCGGCQLQHLPPSEDALWQCAQVGAALARRGLESCPIEPARAMPPATRRRARLAFQRHGRRVALGFRGRAAHQITDIEACALVVPEILALLPPLRSSLAELPLAGQGGELLVTATESGLDLVLSAATEPVLRDREGIAALADAQDLARISWQRGPADVPEVILRRRPVRVTFGGIAVEPPPGAFLQATLEAEAQIRAAVCAAIEPAPGQGRIADLYAGCGTFALPLAAAGHQVQAIEVEADMVAALSAAARTAGLGQRLSAVARDLARAPLAGIELEYLDAVILDPPRAGAQAQARMLAGSKVARIAMVSCNPASFARDARTLVDGGYHLAAVRLIDAFLWSARIELVATFCRPARDERRAIKFGA